MTHTDGDGEINLASLTCDFLIPKPARQSCDMGNILVNAEVWKAFRFRVTSTHKTNCTVRLVRACITRQTNRPGRGNWRFGFWGRFGEAYYGKERQETSNSLYELFTMCITATYLAVEILICLKN